jgi:hypothetical protein
MKISLPARVALAIIASIIFLAAIAVALFLHLNISTTELEKSAQADMGLPVNQETYVLLQGLMEEGPLAQPELQKESLRSFDIDGDGDLDVVGFMKLTFGYLNEDGTPQSTYLFSTWHNDANTYTYYSDVYNDFRFNGKEVPCTIAGLSVAHVALTCKKEGISYPVELHYQEDVNGYYVDFDAHSLSYKDVAGWVPYVSVAGGLSFNHPASVTVTERSYQIYEKVITIVTVKREGDTLFEVHSKMPPSPGGEGLIDNASQIVVLKLPAGTYLERMMAPDASRTAAGVIKYQSAELNNSNDEGSRFSSYKTANVVAGREYTILAPVRSEESLKEIDMMISSIQYSEGRVAGSDIVPLRSSVINFADVATFELPGTVHVLSESLPEYDTSGASVYKSYEISLIDSPRYEKYGVVLSLLPYSTVKGKAAMGGGYDTNTGICFGHEGQLIATKTVGDYTACSFGWGDAGYWRVGNYLIDPDKRYIVSMSVSSAGEGGGEYIEFDPAVVLQSIRSIR